MNLLMNDLNGTGKPAALPAHQGTDKWFAVGDKLAELPVPSTPNTRELAMITAQRARRAERIGIAAGLLTLAVIALVALLAHRRSAASGVPAAAVTAPPAAPAPVAAAAMPAAAPVPTASVTAPAAPHSLARSKHRKTAHKTPAQRRR